MITVEKIIQKNAVESTEQAKVNQAVLSGSVKEIQKSPWPWFIGAGVLLLAAWYFLIYKKGSQPNEGISG